MRRLAAVVALALAGVVLAGAPAHAADDCVSKSEFRAVKKGMTPKQVKREFGTAGKVTSRVEVAPVVLVTREYRTCKPYGSGAVLVSYRSEDGAPLAVTGKTAYWWAR
jgi:hypothetical protein